MMATITYFIAHSNSLTGTIPAELSTMATITFLKLHSNSLTGTIPIELSTMTSITTLLLGSNSLTGTIPVELSTMADLSSIILANNSLAGTVPSYFCNEVPSGCDLVHGGENQWWCTSVCDSGDYPCDLTSSSCVTLTTLEYKLTETYGSCYDLAGVSCSCTGGVNLNDQSLTGTIPPELSACTGLTDMCDYF
jgi:hypothetical protein